MFPEVTLPKTRTSSIRLVITEIAPVIRPVIFANFIGFYYLSGT